MLTLADIERSVWFDSFTIITPGRVALIQSRDVFVTVKSAKSGAMFASRDGMDAPVEVTSTDEINDMLAMPA